MLRGLAGQYPAPVNDVTADLQAAAQWDVALPTPAQPSESARCQRPRARTRQLFSTRNRSSINNGEWRVK